MSSCLVLPGPGAAKFLKSKSASHASLDLPLGPVLFILHNNVGFFSPEVKTAFYFSPLKSLRCAQSCPTLVTLLPVARQAPLPMGLFRQGYWSGLPFPPPGDLPDPGIEPLSLMSPALAGSFFTAFHHLRSSLLNVIRAHFKIQAEFDQLCQMT